MTDTNYPEAVRQLIDIGFPENDSLDYLAKFGLAREHIPNLIRLMEDKELRFGDPTEEEEKYLEEEGDDLKRWYAQIHAWRALAQLKAEEAIPNMIGLIYQAEEYDDDWIDDLIHVFVTLGPACIPALASYLHNRENADYPRNMTIESLKNIAEVFPETREQVIAAIIPALQEHQQNDEGTNGFLISALADLKATEHLELIKEAFDTDNVDLMIMGDFEDVQIEMGLLKERLTPRKFRLVTPRDMEILHAETVKKETAKARKEKNKRKQEKKSRKKNRKKK